MKEHPYGIIDPCLQVSVADGILEEVFRITGQLKLKSCLVFGLCLGFVREGRYLENDNDLDVGVICTEEEKIMLIDSLRKSGFNQGQTHGHNNTHFHKNRVLVDIFFLAARGFYSSFDSVQYKGKSYPVPYPVKEFLSACYSNWKVKEMQMARYISPNAPLNITSVQQFRELRPTEKNEGSHNEVQCVNILHFFAREEYGETLSKLCFLCGKTLILETRAIKGEEWGSLPCINGMTVPTVGRIRMQLNHFGFTVKEELGLREGIVKFVAERMLRIVWDGKRTLCDYREHDVVKLSLYHPQFKSYWERARTEERMAREQQIFKNFKLWYFAPLLYCKECRRIHDGGHRWQAARRLGFKTIWVRIMDYGRSRCKGPPAEVL